MSEYTIERGLGVRDRMNLLASVHGTATHALLDLLGVAPGSRCVDLGCGGGHVTLELARRAGPTGRAIGIDLDAAMLGLAREEATAQGLGNVTFQVAAVDDLSETGFDLAYSRMLLCHLVDPADAIERLAAATRIGGRVVVEDVHFAGCFTEPACAAYDHWVNWFREAVRRNGGDLDIGPRLPGLLRAAGLTDVGVRVAQPAFVDGPRKQLVQMSMEKTRAGIVAAGVATAAEYDAAHAELQAFTNTPGTLVANPRMIQAWGGRA